MEAVVSAAGNSCEQTVTGRQSGHALRVAETVASMRELAALMRLQPVAMGTLGDPWEYISLQYLWAIVSGKGKLDELDNGRYSGIQPASGASLESQR